MDELEKLKKAMDTVSLKHLAELSKLKQNVLSQIKSGTYKPSARKMKILMDLIYTGNVHPPYTHIDKVDPIVVPTEGNILSKMQSEIDRRKKEIIEIENAMAIVRKYARQV